MKAEETAWLIYYLSDWLQKKSLAKHMIQIQTLKPPHTAFAIKPQGHCGEYKFQKMKSVNTKDINKV